MLVHVQWLVSNWRCPHSLVPAIVSAIGTAHSLKIQVLFGALEATDLAHWNFFQVELALVISELNRLLRLWIQSIANCRALVSTHVQRISGALDTFWILHLGLEYFWGHQNMRFVKVLILQQEGWITRKVIFTACRVVCALVIVHASCHCRYRWLERLLTINEARLSSHTL
jgi:hypothetical protein